MIRLNRGVQRDIFTQSCCRCFEPVTRCVLSQPPPVSAANKVPDLRPYHYALLDNGELLIVNPFYRMVVTVVARTLQEAGLIRYARGHIKLLDVPALQETACECYQTIKLNYDALLHPSNK